jgi:hypothetical protein
VPTLATHSRWRTYADAAVRERIDLARRDLAALASEITQAVPVQVRVESGAVPERLAEMATESDRRRPWLVLGRRSRAEHGEAPGATAYRTLGLAQVPVLLHLPTANA